VHLDERAARFAALGDPTRLAIANDLTTSDRSPAEIADRHGIPTNLLAHHLGVLERAGLIDRVASSGDRRRRYVRLTAAAHRIVAADATLPEGPILFVCTHNSARSQFAAAAWRAMVGSPVLSAGTHPADRVHPMAVAAARRAGFDLSDARPISIDGLAVEPVQVVTVCDRAHEELEPDRSWWHWSIPDPVDDPSPRSFDDALEQVSTRVATISTGRNP
jgi:protein-tyrosine-phosphatase/DNA-binding transcriptional ArsR family regulator